YKVVINNGAAFSAEPWGITNARGEVAAIGAGKDGSMPLRTTAWTYGQFTTIDISTGNEWKGSYAAPAGADVVNPLTILYVPGPQESQDEAPVLLN
ncbi:MAG: hypothetical protein EBZ89_04685, partial [Chloroflexi bacterium]|nr:hypothetical protein [Chloroflexota bacterium]